VNCLWENITSPTGLIHLGTNPYQTLSGSEALPSRVVDVTLDQCTFRNVIYDGHVIDTQHQNITVRGTRFENVTLSPYLQSCVLDPPGFYYWCPGLVYCLGDSVCVLHDVCVRDLEYFGFAVMIVNHQSLVTLSGSFFSSGMEQQQQQQQHSSSSSSSSLLSYLGANSTVQAPGQCTFGISRLAADYMSYDCVEEGEYGSCKSTTMCPLV
jgi:hypothetical protein